MTKKLKTRIVAVGSAFLLFSWCFTVPGCDKPQPQTASNGETPKTESVSLPAQLFVSAEPADAKNVLDAKKSAKEGEIVAIRGRIGGAEDPYVAERAIFTIVDKSLPHCGEMKMEDGCKTPWDYCCEPKDKLAENTATIQVVDNAGRPLKIDVSKNPRLKPTSEIVVKGKVAKKDGGKLLIVEATEIFVKG